MRLQGSIGDGGENRPKDIATSKRIFASLGSYAYDRTRPPSPFIDTPLVGAINDLQRRLGLPVTGIIDLDGDEPKELGLKVEELENKSAEEFEVAALPLLALLLAGFCLGIAAGRVMARNRAGDIVAKRAIQQAERDVRAQVVLGSITNFIAAGEMGGDPLITPLPPPRKPEDNKTPDHHEPPDVGKLPPSEPIPDDLIQLPPSFPLPSNPEDLFEVFPADEEAFSIRILERRGSEKTEALNTKIARVIDWVAEKCGITVKHIGGAHKEDGTRLGEHVIKGRDSGGMKGSNFLDVTFKVGTGDKALKLHVNSVDTRADNVTLSTREENAANCALCNKETLDFLVLIQTLEENETLDEKGVEKLIKPILEIMDGRTPKADVKELPSPEVYHLLKKKLSSLWAWRTVA